MSLRKFLWASLAKKTSAPPSDKVGETPEVNSSPEKTSENNPTETKDNPADTKDSLTGMAESVIQNLTAKRLFIKGDSAACLVLAPLERGRKLLAKDLPLF